MSSAPTRSERQACWETRDDFFACLDRFHILDGTKPEARKSCAPELKEFERACPASWVEYFMKRRVQEETQKAQLRLMEEKQREQAAGTGRA